MLRRLRANGLFTKPEKYDFYCEHIEFLGYILLPKGLTMDQAKVQTILDWPEPGRVKDIQSFLGFANFYCRFVYNFSDLGNVTGLQTCTG